MPIIIDDSVQNVTGTTAGLCGGDKLSINDLLYGLMLPSGNDAAYMLALYFGTIILGLNSDLKLVDDELSCKKNLSQQN